MMESANFEYGVLKQLENSGKAGIFLAGEKTSGGWQLWFDLQLFTKYFT